MNCPSFVVFASRPHKSRTQGRGGRKNQKISSTKAIGADMVYLHERRPFFGFRDDVKELLLLFYIFLKNFWFRRDRVEVNLRALPPRPLAKNSPFFNKKK